LASPPKGTSFDSDVTIRRAVRASIPRRTSSKRLRARTPALWVTVLHEKTKQKMLGLMKGSRPEGP
jgi:hypothetical protein